MSFEVDDVCRTCLAFEGTLLSVYDCIGFGGKISVAKILAELTNIEPNKCDGYPEKVCIECLREINRSYSFKLKCENTLSTLKQILQSIGQPVVQLEKSISTKLESKNESSHQQLEARDSEVNKGSKKDLPRESNKESKASTCSGFLIESHGSCQSFPKKENFASKDSNHVLNQNIDKVIPKQNAQLLKSPLKPKSICDEDEKKTIVNNTQEREPMDDFDSIMGELINETMDSDRSDEVAQEPITIKTRSHRMNNKKFNCSLCSKVFTNPIVLTEHLLEHEPVEDEIIPISKANIQKIVQNKSEDKIFTGEKSEVVKMLIKNQKQERLDHTENVRKTKKDQKQIPNKRENSCTTCNEIIKGDLNEHKCANIDQTKIKIDEEHICPKCNEILNSEIHLVEHISVCKGENVETPSKIVKLYQRRNKEKKERYSCEHCGKVFLYNSSLLSHIPVHSTERPYVCSICGKDFVRKYTYKLHILRHSEKKPFKCNECDESFVCRRELKSHMLLHTGDHPFKCDMCTKAFRFQYALRVHRRRHTGERPYSCDKCDKSFTQLTTLKTHQKSHKNK